MDDTCPDCCYIYQNCICNELIRQKSNMSKNSNNCGYSCANCGYDAYTCICDGMQTSSEKQKDENGVPLKTEKYYRIFDTTGVTKQRKYLINSIAQDSNYGLNEDEVVLLLIYFQWNKDNLDQKWWDDQDKIREKAGLTLTKESIDALKKMKIPNSSNSCLVCYGNDDLFAMSCGHHFCMYCWQEYCKVKSLDFLVALSSTCMQKNCSLIIPEKHFFRYLESNSMQWNNFNKAVIRNFINTNKNLKTCPNGSCNYIVECYEYKPVDIMCICNTRFCFKCEHDSHRPLRCNVLQVWEKKHSKEDADDLWIKANCKVCPHCGQRIERSTGCLYMLCDPKAKGCGKAFCYVCETDWTKHTQEHFTCNKFTPNIEKKQNEAEMIKEELKRMQHFYNRYTNFLVSEKMAQKLKPKIELLQNDLIKQNISYSELKFLEESLLCIINSNCTIKNTYIYAYFLRDNAQEKPLFEYNQGQLEKNTDNLYKLIDVDFYSVFEFLEKSGYSAFQEKFNELKLKAINYSSASNKFQLGVIEDLETDKMHELLDLEGTTRVYTINKDPKKDGHFKYINEEK